MAITAVSTGEPDPEDQQAALDALQNGWWQRRILEAIAEVGTIEAACRIVDISQANVRRLQESDPAFKAQVQVSRQRFGEKLLGKSVAAVLAADPEQLIRTPTLAIAAVNWFNPELRPNGTQVNIDARSVNLTLLEDGQLERIKQALRDSLDEPNSERLSEESAIIEHEPR